MIRYLLVMLLLAGPLGAVQPDEILSDPALEARARVISKELRCLVCRNESIDESNAPLARDLRLVVRERLVAGDSNAEVIDFIVTRYGEFALLRPQTSGANWLLWAAGPLMLLGAGILGLAYLRRRAATLERPDAPLSAAEQERLRKILNQE